MQALRTSARRSAEAAELVHYYKNLQSYADDSVDATGFNLQEKERSLLLQYVWLLEHTVGILKDHLLQTSLFSDVLIYAKKQSSFRNFEFMKSYHLSWWRLWAGFYRIRKKRRDWGFNFTSHERSYSLSSLPKTRESHGYRIFARVSTGKWSGICLVHGHRKTRALRLLASDRSKTTHVFKNSIKSRSLVVQQMSTTWRSNLWGHANVSTTPPPNTPVPTTPPLITLAPTTPPPITPAPSNTPGPTTSPPNTPPPKTPAPTTPAQLLPLLLPALQLPPPHLQALQLLILYHQPPVSPTTPAPTTLPPNSPAPTTPLPNTPAPTTLFLHLQSHQPLPLHLQSLQLLRHHLQILQVLPNPTLLQILQLLRHHPDFKHSSS